MNGLRSGRKAARLAPMHVRSYAFHFYYPVTFPGRAFD